jgi:hypothetical protein
MTVRWSVLPVWLVLCGCSSPGPQALLAPPHRSWAATQGHYRSPQLEALDDKPSKPEQPNPAIEARKAELERLPKYSHEWIALRKQIDAEIEADDNARIAKVMVICRGCDPVSKPLGAVVSSNR